MDTIFFHKTGFFSMSQVQHVQFLSEHHEVIDTSSVPRTDRLGNRTNVVLSIEDYNARAANMENRDKICFVHVHLGYGLFVLLNSYDGEKFLSIMCNSRNLAG